jgi:hypothetical protein
VERFRITDVTEDDAAGEPTRTLIHDLKGCVDEGEIVVRHADS